MPHLSSMTLKLVASSSRGSEFVTELTSVYPHMVLVVGGTGE